MKKMDWRGPNWPTYEQVLVRAEKLMWNTINEEWDEVFEFLNYYWNFNTNEWEYDFDGVMVDIDKVL